MFKKIRNFIISIKDGIENIIIWFPIIWKDRDWDQWFLYTILKFKLSNMEKYYRKYGISANSEKTANQIKICVDLLGRLLEDEYGNTVFKKHEEKWGDLDFSFEPYKNDLHKCLITRPNIKTEEDEKLERKQSKRLHEHESYLIKQDVDYLFKIMKKHIQTWWD